MSSITQAMLEFVFADCKIDWDNIEILLFQNAVKLRVVLKFGKLRVVVKKGGL